MKRNLILGAAITAALLAGNAQALTVTDIDANNLKTIVQGITRGKKIDVRIIIRYFKDIDDEDIEHVVHCLSILEASTIGKCVIHNTDLDSWYNWRYVDIYDEGSDGFDPLSQY